MSNGAEFRIGAAVKSEKRETECVTCESSWRHIYLHQLNRTEFNFFSCYFDNE
jgi:hypothetical protein